METKHHLDNHTDSSQLQPDSSSTDNDNNLLQALTQELQTLVLKSSFQGEAFCSDQDRDQDQDSGGVDGDDPLKQVVDDVAVNDAFEAECFNGAEAAEEKNDEEKYVFDDDDEVGLKGNEEIEIVDGDDEIGGYEDNGNDSGYEHVENEGKYVDGDGWEDGGSVNVVEDGRSKGYHYPLRPDAEDCSYYMRTGMCKYGSNCKFNHPLRRRHQPIREIHKQKEENMEIHGQIECKYYLSPAGCKYGKSCKFSHGRGKTGITPVVEYNFLGLPIRQGEKECPYYMRNGSCKYGPNCRFNHPDPSAVGDAPTSYGNDGPLPLQPLPQPNIPNIPNMPSWSVPRTPDPSAAFVPVMYPPTQNIPPSNPDWNGYQAPAPVPAHVYPSSDRGLPIPPAFFLNNPPTDANMYTHHQQPMVVSEYPERPGQPECSYFMKTGDCKYRTSCKFHHPKSRITRSTPSILSDKGLPLRPDQNICTYYSRYGICKYGPACKYDHPVNCNINAIPAGDGYDGSDRRGALIQQSV